MTFRPPLDEAETEVLRAAVGCINHHGHAYSIATDGPAARTFFVNERAMRRLEAAVAKLKDARKAARRAKR